MKNADELPLLSIVIPAYNRQDFLDSLLLEISSSIMKIQMEDSVEVIVIDDYSSIFLSLPKLSCFSVLERNDTNLGAPYSREKGFQLSRGKFIHFHDSDDTVTESWLLDIVEALKNNPKTDLLMTARFDNDNDNKKHRSQKYFHKHVSYPEKIQSRLIYRNCMGPLGGVTFSRRVLEKVEFKRFSSCQDWQMYIDAIKHAKVLSSLAETQFIFNKTGDDRISHNPRKKILGHLQLAKITGQQSIFKRNIRLFYLYTCKQHIFNKGGGVLRFYKKNRFSIILTFLVVSVYWRIT